MAIITKRGTANVFGTPQSGADNQSDNQHLEDINKDLGDHSAVTANKTPAANAGLLDKIGGLLQYWQDTSDSNSLKTKEQLIPAYEDNSNAIARVGAHAAHVATGDYTTTASYALIDDGSVQAQLMATVTDGGGNLNSKTKLVAVVENTGSTNTADAKLQGRYNDLSVQSPWIDLVTITGISTNDADSLSLSTDSAGYDEYRLIAQDGSGSTTVKGYLTAKGA